jgi:hypothetical protein
VTVFAHPGHWLANLLYLAPVLAMIGALVWARLRGGQPPDETEPTDEPELTDGSE